MKLAKRLALAGLVVTTLGFAQSPITQTLPPGFDNVSTGSTDTQPFGVTYATLTTPATGMIFQYGFQSTMFTYQSVQRIDSVAFRVPAGTAVGGTTNLVDIWMTTTPLEITTLSNTFTNNHGADRTQVYSGSITWPAGTIAAPGQWVTIPLTTPFTYDPHNNKDFLVEVVCNDPLTTASTNIEVSFGPCRTQSNNTSATALTSNAGTVTAALLQLGITPIPNLYVSSSGNGVGDLILALTDIPNNAVTGWTLISTSVSAPVNTGPILGIYPSQLTLDILFTPPSIGNPLSWVNAGVAGLYPTSPLVFGPGSVSFLAGQTWDFVTLTVDGNFQFAGRSNVQRVTF